MAERRVVLAGGALLAAFVFAAAAWLWALLREPPPVTAASVVVAVPPAPVPADPLEAEPEPDRPATPAPERVPAAPGPAAATDAGEATTDPDTPLGPPERLVVVATGIAWNDDLARTAAFRLPPAVALALPADLPDARQRLADWRAAERDVVVRFAWTDRTDGGPTPVPLDGPRELQAARLDTQWEALSSAAAGALVEPLAAAALAPVAQGVAVDMGVPLFLATAEPAAAPHAWRIDAARLGESGFTAALDAVATAPIAGDTLVVLLEIYPALLDTIVAWLQEVEPQLVPVSTFARELP